MSRVPLPFPRRGLYALTPDVSGDFAGVVAGVDAAITGGAVAVQYRDKPASAVRRRARALVLRELCHRHGVPLIVNDDAELAAAIDADGVHIGRDDAALATARRIVGAHRIVGVSCYDSVPRARQAIAGGADYVAFGSFYPSATKPGAVRCPPEVLAAAATDGGPAVVAIGGITPENAGELLARGAGVLAVIAALFEAADTAAAARAFARLF